MVASLFAGKTPLCILLLLGMPEGSVFLSLCIFPMLIFTLHCSNTHLVSFKLPDCPSMCGLCINFDIDGHSVLWQRLVLGFSSVPDNLFWCGYQLLQFQLWDIGLTATTAFEEKIKLLSRCQAQCITFGVFSSPFSSGILLRMNYVHLFQKSFLSLQSWPFFLKWNDCLGRP